MNPEEIVNAILTDDVKGEGWAKGLTTPEAIKTELVTLQKLKGQKVIPDDSSSDEMWTTFKDKLSSGASYDSLFGDNEKDLKEVLAPHLKKAGLHPIMAKEVKAGIDAFIASEKSKSAVNADVIKSIFDTEDGKKADELIGKMYPALKDELPNLDKSALQALTKVLASAHAKIYPNGDTKPAVGDGSRSPKPIDQDYIKRMEQIAKTPGIDQQAARRDLMKEYGHPIKN